MLNPDIRDGNLNDPLLESGNPIAAPQRRESLGDGFIQSLRRHFDGVSDALEVLDRNAAGSDGHKRTVAYFAFYSL